MLGLTPVQRRDLRGPCLGCLGFSCKLGHRLRERGTCLPHRARAFARHGALRLQARPALHWGTTPQGRKAALRRASQQPHPSSAWQWPCLHIRKRTNKGGGGQPGLPLQIRRPMARAWCDRPQAPPAFCHSDAQADWAFRHGMPQVDAPHEHEQALPPTHSSADWDKVMRGIPSWDVPLMTLSQSAAEWW